MRNRKASFLSTLTVSDSSRHYLIFVIANKNGDLDNPAVVPVDCPQNQLSTRILFFVMGQGIETALSSSR